MKKNVNDVAKMIQDNGEFVWKLTKDKKYDSKKFFKKPCASCTYLVKKSMLFCEIVTVKSDDNVIELKRYTICSRCFDLFYNETTGIGLRRE